MESTQVWMEQACLGQWWDIRLEWWTDVDDSGLEHHAFALCLLDSICGIHAFNA